MYLLSLATRGRNKDGNVYHYEGMFNHIKVKQMQF